MANEPKESLFPDVTCPVCGPECACGHEERAIRRIIEGTWPHGAMTAMQREWCIQEADSAGEGNWNRAELEPMSDKDLALTVMRAWSDYVNSHF